MIGLNVAAELFLNFKLSSDSADLVHFYI